jgi:hypothetical protein
MRGMSLVDVIKLLGHPTKDTSAQALDKFAPLRSVMR